MVVDKPVGRRRPPDPRLDRPDRDRRPARRRAQDRHQRRGRAPGHRAPAGREHHRADGGGQERARLQRAEAGVPGARRWTSATTPWSRATPIRCAAPWTRRSTGTPSGTAGGRWWPAGGRASPTTTRSRRSARASLLDIKLETGRTHQIRVHMSALRHPCVGDLLYGADPVLAARLGLTRQWLHAVPLAFAHPADRRRVAFTSDYPADLATRSRSSGPRADRDPAGADRDHQRGARCPAGG